MFKDMALANTVNDEFKSRLDLANAVKMGGVDLYVRVLTTGFWPGQNAPPPVNLPRVPSEVYLKCIFGLTQYSNLGFWSLQELLLGQAQWQDLDPAAQRRDGGP